MIGGVSVGSIILPSNKTEEICHRLPTNEIRKATSVLAVIHPNDKDILILKSRHEDVDTLKLGVLDFELYSKPLLYNDDYSFFNGKNILLDRKILPSSALEVLMSFE